MDLSPPSFKPAIRRSEKPFLSGETSHRFMPAEKSRQTVEPALKSIAKVAGELNFQPVATLKLADKNVFVRPVNNTRPRPVSHLAAATQRVVVPHQRPVDISPELHSQIKIRAQAASAVILPPKPLLTIPSNQVLTQDVNYNSVIKGKLDQINKLLYEQIKQKVAQEIAKQRQGVKPLPLPTKVVSGPPSVPGLKPTPAQMPLTPPVAKTTSPVTQLSAALTPSEALPTPMLKPRETNNFLVTNGQNQFLEEIKHLDQEISSLNKEVLELEKVIHLSLAEREEGQLGNLENKIGVDEKVLTAVVDWRQTLNNLIDNHSRAIKYLKQREDWLEYRERKLTHPEKHLKLHHKPKSVGVSFPEISKDPTLDTTHTREQVVSRALPVAEKPLVVEPVNKTSPPIPSKQLSEAPNQLTKPPEKPAQAEEVLANQKSALEEVGLKAKSELTGLVKDIIAETGQNTKPTQVVVNLSKESSLPPVQNKLSLPVQNLPVSVTINQADIEKQILEAAEKEEQKKQDKIKEQTEEQKKPQTNPPAVATPVTIENLNSSFDKLKTNLTTLNTPAGSLTQEEREKMLYVLQNLEKEAVITKQMGELKASQERRKINAEIQRMFTSLQTPSQQTPSVPVPPRQTNQQMEALKVAEKRKTTPEEKAKIITEIKELEREDQVRKAAETTRPTVKAQPAFGRMLPNTPTIPNVINGLVKDNRGLLLPTVVIIIKDKNGNPVRALKTNKLGQFALSTPVPNGIYVLELEKSGYDFDIIEVDVDGTIMKPIEIKAR